MKRNLLKTWRAEGGPARLRALRSARGMKLADLAAKAGVSKGTLSKLENPTLQPNPSLDMIESIAAGLGVEREELFESGSLETNRRDSTPADRSLELYLREMSPSSRNAQRFRRVATHPTPPKTVPDWRRFTEWLALFTGRDPRPVSARNETRARIRAFKRPMG
jgi:transcriptional regulator with XRE-family HTH domain